MDPQVKAPVNEPVNIRTIAAACYLFKSALYFCICTRLFKYKVYSSHPIMNAPKHMSIYYGYSQNKHKIAA